MSRRSSVRSQSRHKSLVKQASVPLELSEEQLAAVVLPAAAHPRFQTLKASPQDERDLQFSVKVNYTQLPDYVDLTPSLPAPMDQGAIGSCAANAGGVALRYLYKKQLQQDWMPSRLALYYVTRVYMTGNNPSEDTGCILRDVCKAVAKYQLPPEMYWRYDISKFTLPPPFLQQNETAPTPLIEYSTISRDVRSLKSALAEGFPIVIGIPLYESFMSPRVALTGVVPMPDMETEKLIGGHAVLVVGYDEETWIVRNSWSSKWGMDGNFTLPEAYLTSPDLCFDAFVFHKAIEE